jgi:hypothetical protein
MIHLDVELCSQETTSPETEALFAITVAMENGPQLVLQFTVVSFLLWNLTLC